MEKIKVYTAMRMTGRMCDELVQEAEMLCRALENHGLVPLNPVIEENVRRVHETLPAGDIETLRRYWRRDKEMIREADVLLDYDSMGRSDGVNNELGYARWCLWKPTVRVWTGGGGAISRLEHDIIVPTLREAIDIIQREFGDYARLRAWRIEMWNRCFARWWAQQQELRDRYGIKINVKVED